MIDVLALCALVPPGQRPVDPHGGFVVDRSEVEDEAVAVERRHIDESAVPHRPIEPRVADAALPRLRREGHLDEAVPGDLVRGSPGRLRIEREGPCPVE